MWIHLKWRQSWEGVETNLHKYSAPCFQHLKKFDFTQLMLGAAKRLIVLVTLTAMFNPVSLVTLVNHSAHFCCTFFYSYFSFSWLWWNGLLKVSSVIFPRSLFIRRLACIYFHANLWIGCLILSTAALPAFLHPWSSAIHQSATEWLNSTLQFAICESCVCYLQTHKKLTALFIRSLSELAYEFECLPKSKHPNKAFVVRGCSYIT